MFKNTKAFSSFSVDSVADAKKFYEQTLGVEVEQTPMGLKLKVAGSAPIYVYEKKDHVPATFTVLNFSVENVDQAVEDLKAKGIKFEQYSGMTDEKDIARGIATKRGPDVAWFKDPAGNFLSVLKEF